MKPIIFCLVSILPVTASADQLITPSSVTVVTGSEFFPAINMINGSGLSEPTTVLNFQSVTHSAASATTAWTTNNPNGASDYFATASPGPLPVFTFTLPATSTISALVYWGYHFNAANGNETREFFVEFSQDGGSTFPESATVFSNLSNFAISASKTLPFGQDFTANTIRVSLTDNHFGGTAAGGDRLGLGEIKFLEIVPPALEASPIDIQSDGSNESLSFSLSNTLGTETYTIDNITVDGPNASIFTVNTSFPLDVPVGQTVTIDYTLSPEGSIAELDANFVVNLTPTGTVTVPINGYICDPWIEWISPDFGMINSGETNPATIRIQNEGATRDLVLSGSSIVFDRSGAFTIANLFDSPVTIPPKGSAEIPVTFNSTGLSAGTYVANASITSNDITLPDAEIRIEATVAKSPIPASLVGWWSFDGNGLDGSSFAHPITENGTPNYTAPGANANTGTAATFDGSTSIDIAASGILNPDSFTVTLWANPDDLLGYQSLITSRTDNSGLDGRTYGYVLYMDNVGDWSFWSGDGAPSGLLWDVNKQASNAPLVGQWSHLALTYDRTSATKTLYLNGEVLAVQADTFLERNLTTALHLGSGGDTGTQYLYKGKIDDLAVFCEVLTHAQIQAIMENGVASFAGLNDTLAITNLEIQGANVVITSTTGLRPGVNYHLQSGTSLDDFQPVPDTNFTADTVNLPTLPASSPKRFVRIVEGPGPVL